MTGFARHYDAAVERANGAMALNRELTALNRELLADLAAERFDAEAGERLKSMLDGIVANELRKATAHVRTSRTVEELFAFFDKRR